MYVWMNWIKQDDSTYTICLYKELFYQETFKCSKIKVKKKHYYYNHNCLYFIVSVDKRVMIFTHLFFCFQTSYFGRGCDNFVSQECQSQIVVSFIRIYIFTETFYII